MSIDQLMKKANKLIARFEKLNNKDESARLACKSRSKLIPANATIRKEYVNCKKPACQEKHGPYYYAYWKVEKKLKKKYIGRYFERDNDNESELSEKTQENAAISNNSVEANNSSNTNEPKTKKKKKRRKLLITA